MISEVIGEGATSGDPTMEHSNIGNSSTGRSTHPAMSGNIRELATSLVEIKIALGDLPMPKATAFQGGDGQQPIGDAADPLNEDPLNEDPPIVDLVDSEDSHEDPMNVDDLPMGSPADAGVEAKSAEDRAVDAEGQTKVLEEAPLKGDGVAQQEQSDPSSRDLLMTKANPVDPVDPMVIEEPFDQSPLRVTAVVPFNLPLSSTQPEETPRSTLEPIRMNVDVVDDTMRDLDPFNLVSKALVLCPQPLAVRKVPDFPDSSQVPVDSTFDDRDSDPNKPELNFDLHEGLAGKAINEEVIDLDPMPH